MCVCVCVCVCKCECSVAPVVRLIKLSTKRTFHHTIRIDYNITIGENSTLPLYIVAIHVHTCTIISLAPWQPT